MQLKLIQAGGDTNQEFPGTGANWCLFQDAELIENLGRVIEVYFISFKPKAVDYRVPGPPHITWEFSEKEWNNWLRLAREFPDRVSAGYEVMFRIGTLDVPYFASSKAAFLTVCKIPVEHWAVLEVKSHGGMNYPVLLNHGGFDYYKSKVR